MVASDMPRCERIEKRADPTMIHTMKQEKTMPRGVAPVSRTGVQRKTKMYMQDSNREEEKELHRNSLKREMDT